MNREEQTYSTNTGEFIAEKLLPCPFCGGEPEFITIGNDYTKSRKAEIKCTNCFVKRTTGAIRNDLEWCGRKAIELWNKRTNGLSLPPAEGAEQRIRVRNILQDFYRRGEYELEQAEEDIMRLFQPQPTAEGAEEILDKYPHSIEYPSFVHENSAIAAMTEFATLHAQRIAEKMVSERLRGKYVFTYEELRKVCCDFFRSWWNTPGSNTDQGFDAWALKTGLKK